MLLNLFLLLLCLNLIVKLALNSLNIKHIRSHENEVPLEFQEKISLSDHQKAARYSVTKLHFSQINLVKNFILSLILLLMVVPVLDDALRALTFNEISRGLVFFIVLAVVSFIFDLPSSLYQTFVIEEKFGFNKTTVRLFFMDLFKSTILSALIGLPLLAFLLWAMSGEVFQKWWWLGAYGVFMSFQLLLFLLYPRFIAPLFNKFTPLENEEIKEKVTNLAHRIGLQFKEYFVMNASLRSSHGNAYFTGLGKNKRIVFFDTLLETLNADEVEGVLAHEIGHMKKGHIKKKLLLMSLMGFVLFYFLGLMARWDYLFQSFGLQMSSYMTLWLFSLILGELFFLFTPLGSWLSRKDEYEADEFAATFSESEFLISALVKMYRDNSSTLTPHPTYSRFYFSHPPALERITFLKTLKR